MNRVKTILAVFVLALIGCSNKTTSDIATLGQPVPANFENYNQGALLDASTLLRTYARQGSRIWLSSGDAFGLDCYILRWQDDDRIRAQG